MGFGAQGLGFLGFLARPFAGLGFRGLGPGRPIQSAATHLMKGAQKPLKNRVGALD